MDELIVALLSAVCTACAAFVLVGLASLLSVVRGSLRRRFWGS